MINWLPELFNEEPSTLIRSRYDTQYLQFRIYVRHWWYTSDYGEIHPINSVQSIFSDAFGIRWESVQNLRLMRKTQQENQNSKEKINKYFLFTLKLKDWCSETLDCSMCAVHRGQQHCRQGTDWQLITVFEMTHTLTHANLLGIDALTKYSTNWGIKRCLIASTWMIYIPIILIRSNLSSQTQYLLEKVDLRWVTYSVKEWKPGTEEMWTRVLRGARQRSPGGGGGMLTGKAQESKTALKATRLSVYQTDRRQHITDREENSVYLSLRHQSWGNTFLKHILIWM